VILPFPVELLRFLEHSSLPHAEKAAEVRAARRSARPTLDDAEPEELLGTEAPAEIPPPPKVESVPELTPMRDAGAAPLPDPIDEELAKEERRKATAETNAQAEAKGA
jgi:hypothetical protein